MLTVKIFTGVIGGIISELKDFLKAKIFWGLHFKYIDIFEISVCKSLNFTDYEPKESLFVISIQLDSIINFMHEIFLKESKNKILIEKNSTERIFFENILNTNHICYYIIIIIILIIIYYKNKSKKNKNLK